MMHAGNSAYQQRNTADLQNCFSSRSGVAYQPPISGPPIGAGIATISTEKESFILRGVPSRELRFQEETTMVNEKKRDEKESHYSRHVSSKTSFGN